MQPNTPKERLLRLPEVVRRVGVSKSTWWRWIGEGRAPQGKKLSPRITVWPESVIDQYIAQAVIA